MKFQHCYSLAIQLLTLFFYNIACTSLPDSQSPVAQLRLVESFPSETAFDSPDIPNTEAQWMDMISKARVSIDIAEFYIQTLPNSGMDRVLKALEAAGTRGVKIRFLIDDAFIKRYPLDTGKAVEAVKKWPETQVRVTNRWSKSGGVLHAKYFIIDEQDAFVGSQNFDWRALEHIKELGFRFRSPPLVRSLQAVFNDDWENAQNQDAPQNLNASEFQPAIWRDDQGIANQVAIKISPNPSIDSPLLWDWPDMVKMIQEAKAKLRLSAMAYRPIWRDKRAWIELESLLVSAAERGVNVQLMVDNHNRANEFKPLIDAGVKVGFVKIPQHSSGAIPYARLIHAKYMVVDDQKAWLGTSNFEADYFYKSRNISFVIDSPKLAKELAGVFDRYWGSPQMALVKADSKGIMKVLDQP